MAKMGTLKKNGDQKTYFGPHGDQSPQMGTNVGAVHHQYIRKATEYLLSVIIGVDVVENLRLGCAIRFRNQGVEDHLPRKGSVPKMFSLQAL